MSFETNFSPKVIAGAGALQGLKSLKGKRAFILMSGSFAKSNFAVSSSIEDYLKEAGFEVMTLQSQGREPTLDYVRESATLMQEFAPDTIVAVGGGSTIDSAKIMRVLYECPDITDEALFKRFNLPVVERKAKLVAIPTTSGTGAEVTPFNMVFVKTGNPELPLSKNAVADYQTMPEMVILDPALTAGLSPEITANTGLDALVHAIEAYSSNKPKNIFSDVYTLEAIKTIVEYLPAAYKNGDDLEARGKMQYAATMAGIAIASRGTGLAHGMGNPLGALGIPHGAAVAIVLAAVMNFNHSACTGAYMDIAHCLGIGAGSDDQVFSQLIDKISALIKEVGFPEKITAFGVSKEEYMRKIDSMAKEALVAGATQVNPRVPSFGDIKQILTSIC